MTRDGQYKRILVGYDGSDNSKRALDRAVELARSAGSELSVVVAVDTVSYALYSTGQYYYPIRDDMTQHAKKLLAEAIETAKLAGIAATGWVKEGRPADTIITTASENGADLIVVGRRGIKGIERFLIGSVSSAVVSSSKCDVLVVK
jgi:nucleotide-binding universal stress UspA family protein